MTNIIIKLEYLQSELATRELHISSPHSLGLHLMDNWLNSKFHFSVGVFQIHLSRITVAVHRMSHLTSLSESDVNMNSLLTS